MEKHIRIGTNDELVRLGVDLPADLKKKFAIEALEVNMTMTQVVEALVSIWLSVRKSSKTLEQLEALVCAWVAGEIKLPEK